MQVRTLTLRRQAARWKLSQVPFFPDLLLLSRLHSFLTQPETGESNLAALESHTKQTFGRKEKCSFRV